MFTEGSLIGTIDEESCYLRKEGSVGNTEGEKAFRKL